MERQQRLEAKLKVARAGNQERKLLRLELEAERKKNKLAWAKLDHAMQDKIDTETYVTELERRQ